MYIFKFRPLAILGLLGTLALTGCAGPIERWIVQTRVHQGDVALERGNLADAELSYRLALRVDPADEAARTGFVQAAGDYAQAEYAKGQFDTALTIINEGLKSDPSSVRLSALRTSIDQAKLKREIVISNYPTYREAGLQLQRAYAEIDVSNKAIMASLRSFSYTYDAVQLTKAIKQSYELQLDVAKDTNRLIVYRQLVESGVPESARAASSASGASLLPLP